VNSSGRNRSPADGDPPLRELYLQLPFLTRLTIGVSVVVAGLGALLSVVGGSTIHRHWIAGPLYLVFVESVIDKAVGQIVATALTLLIASSAVTPRPLAVAASLLGITLWVLCGVACAALSSS
jgi:hypothetical protein